jgi:endonuclease G
MVMNKFSVGYYYKLMAYDRYLKSVIKIGYNNKYKGPSFVWYRLSKGTINRSNIRLRNTFKPDYRIESRYRVTDKDYKNSGYDRGHLASDASFDYNLKALNDIYVYSNAIPQKHKMNAYVWGGIEKYARYITLKLKYTYVINLVIYGNKTIGKGVGVPDTMYKVILNKKNKFMKIFRVKQSDTARSLKNYEISYEDLINEIKL